MDGRRIAKIVVGLTPAVTVLALFARWFIVGTMEHGWNPPSNPEVELIKTAHCFVMLIAGIAFVAVAGLGVHEAVAAARGSRRRSSGSQWVRNPGYSPDKARFEHRVEPSPTRSAPKGGSAMPRRNGR